MDDCSETVEIGGQTYVMRPTLAAMRAINRQFGGYVAAAQKVAGVDVEAMALVIAHGAGLDKRGREQLLDAVYTASPLNLIEPVSTFLATLMNGGRKRVAEPAEGDEGNAPTA